MKKKNEPTPAQTPSQTLAIDESIRFVQEQVTKEKKDAPVKK